MRKKDDDTEIERITLLNYIFRSKYFNLVIFILIIFFILLFWFRALIPIEIIGPGYVGVIYNAFGGVDMSHTMQPGWNFKIPILQTIYHVKTARDTVNMYGTAFGKDCNAPDCDDIAVQVPSKEGLLITVDVSIFYKVKPDKAASIIQTLTPNYRDGTIMPSLRSSVRDITGGMAIIELYGEGRTQLEQGIFNKMQPKLDSDGFILEQILIRDVVMPDQITKSIQDKQSMEQSTLQKQYEVELAQKEAQRKIMEAQGIANSTIIQAQGNAETIRIINEQLKQSPEYTQFLAIQKWNGVLPLATGGVLPFIQIPINQSK
ncbi:MAG: prohibitin family protein [Candidatus Micrarchaeota archaeon]|nr:prohibitin family protein [Candidatus Micrarchaeota archaeon]